MSSSSVRTVYTDLEVRPNGTDAAFRADANRITVENSTQFKSIDTPSTPESGYMGLYYDTSKAAFRSKTSAGVEGSIEAPATSSVAGIVQLASSGEVATGTATDRGVTPASLGPKGGANGFCPLDANSRVPVANMAISAYINRGNWNASTNSPTLANGVGENGDTYYVNVTGTTSLDGITDWVQGDRVVFDGTVWQKQDNTDAVQSVAGMTGVVTLAMTNITDAGTAATLDTGVASGTVPAVGSGGLGNSQVVVTNASGGLESAAKATGFNLAVGTTSGTVAAGDHTHAAADIASGTFADARISESSVTQHRAALTLTVRQIASDNTGTVHPATATALLTLTVGADGTYMVTFKAIAEDGTNDYFVNGFYRLKLASGTYTLTPMEVSVHNPGTRVTVTASASGMAFNFTGDGAATVKSTYMVDAFGPGAIAIV